MNKMYILVRKDIPKSWIPIQACHAVAELMLEYPHEEFFQWGNGTMVMLGVDSDEELVYWRNKIRKDKTVPYQLYFEHHNKDGHLGPTAMAVLGNENTKEILKDLKLL